MNIEQAISILSREFLGKNGVCAIYENGEEIAIEVCPTNITSRCAKVIPPYIGHFPVTVWRGEAKIPQRSALISMPTASQLGGQLGGTWTEDATEAFKSSPEYFMNWYTIKSLALVAAAATAAYLYGKEAGRKEAAR